CLSPHPLFSAPLGNTSRRASLRMRQATPSRRTLGHLATLAALARRSGVQIPALPSTLRAPSGSVFSAQISGSLPQSLAFRRRAKLRDRLKRTLRSMRRTSSCRRKGLDAGRVPSASLLLLRTSCSELSMDLDPASVQFLQNPARSIRHSSLDCGASHRELPHRRKAQSRVILPASEPHGPHPKST